MARIKKKKPTSEFGTVLDPWRYQKANLSIVKVLFLRDSILILSLPFCIYYLDYCFLDNENYSLTIFYHHDVKHWTDFRILQNNYAYF